MWAEIISIWDEFLAFMDRAFQWLQYVFGAIDTWPPVDYPDINEETK